MQQDEEPIRSVVRQPVLGRMGVAELESYIVMLQAEIGRAAAEIARKQSHRSAADDVFKRRD